VLSGKGACWEKFGFRGVEMKKTPSGGSGRDLGGGVSNFGH